MSVVYFLIAPIGILAMLLLIALSASGGELAGLFWLLGIAAAIGAGWAIDQLTSH